MKNKVVEKAELFTDRKCDSYLLVSYRSVASFVINEHGFNNIYYSLKVLSFPTDLSVVKCCIWTYSVKSTLISNSEMSQADLLLK